MASQHPLAEVEVLCHYGKTTQAIRLLREALKVAPDQPDLRAKLAELEAGIAAPRTSNFRAMLLPWLFFLASAGIVFTPLIVAANLLSKPSISLLLPENPLLIALAGLGVLIGAIVLWVQLFLHAWFRYLRSLPLDSRTTIEKALPNHINIIAFQPTYSNVRRKYLDHT